MPAFPLVVSFYTKNTPYESEVERLILSCKGYGVDYDIEGVESAGSWELNCAYKPLFLMRMLEKHKRSVLWVDADASFKKSPSSLGAFDADIAVKINYSCPLDHPSKVISGTVYANYTEASLSLLRLWAELSLKELARTDRKEEFWDQMSLRDAIYQCKQNARVGFLPLSYVKIFDHFQDVAECLDPVIEHFQASRLYKAWVTRSNNVFFNSKK